MTTRTTIHGLQVATELFDFINQQVLPGTGVSEANFWKGFDSIVADLAPKNAALLGERDRLQAELDTWHSANPGPIRDMVAYRKFLETIGYLVPEPKKVKATTKNVDDELATQAGPQLVVPILNARYALNAANARWGSLYDALYGTDVIPETGGADKGPGYNEVRGAKVIAKARQVLDQAAPLADRVARVALVLPDDVAATRRVESPRRAARTVDRSTRPVLLMLSTVVSPVARPSAGRTSTVRLSAPATSKMEPSLLRRLTPQPQPFRPAWPLRLSTL